MIGRTRWLGIVGVLMAGSMAGCWPSFPDNLLNLDVPRSDVPRDSGRPDAVTDAGPVDTGPANDLGPTPDNGMVVDTGTDAGNPTDAMDATLGDVGVDAGEDVFMLPADADVCANYPLPTNAPAMRVFGNLDEPVRDVAFDSMGRAAVAHGSRITFFDRGGTPMDVLTAVPGTVVGIKFTRINTLVVAYNNPNDAGGIQGNIGILIAGNPNLTPLPFSVGRVGGLAIDRNDRVWYTDTTNNQLYRVQPNGTERSLVYTFPCGDAGQRICAPGQLAFGVGERALFVSTASSVDNTVYRLGLTQPDGGASTVMGTPSMVLAGLPSVTGLAVDECNNVYIADEMGTGIYRIGEMGTGLSTLTRAIPSPRGLAFGTGGMFDSRVLFSLSAGPERGLYVTQSIARGNVLAPPAMP